MTSNNELLLLLDLGFLLCGEDGGQSQTMSAMIEANALASKAST